MVMDEHITSRKHKNQLNDPGPEMRSITYEQLFQVEIDAKKKFGPQSYEVMTMHDINEKIIKPQCKVTGKPYALSLNAPHGIPMEVFCTHCWGENFHEFLRSIHQAYEHCVKKPNLWLCSFALFQGSPDEVRNQISGGDLPDAAARKSSSSNSNLDNTPFVEALRHATEFLVVRSSSVNLYSRVWCVCELIFAIEFKLVPGKTKITGPDNFHDNDSISVKDTDSYSQTDKERILKHLFKRYGNYDEIDKIIAQFQAHEVSTLNNIQVPSQKEVSGRYMPILSKYGSKHTKEAASYIRKGIKGEIITTVLFGIKETENTIKDDDSYIVCGPTALEMYCITKEEFSRNYDTSHPSEIKIKLPPYQELRKLGFKNYKSSRSILAHEIQQDDIKWFQSTMTTKNNSSRDENDEVYFFASWGEHQLVTKGDYLVTTFPLDGKSEVYRIERVAFQNTYGDYKGAGKNAYLSKLFLKFCTVM